MQHTDKMREEFERTSARDLRRQPPKGNNYIDPMTQMDWLAFRKGWMQSREALVVELPEERVGRTTYLDDHALARDAGRGEGIRECRAAIEAVGVTVRG